MPTPVRGVGGAGTLSGVAGLSPYGVAEGYCAVLTSGGVDCWGSNEYGDLGNGTETPSPTPTAVVGVGGRRHAGGVKQVSTTTYSHCALLTSGGVDCWGPGDSGQLGNGPGGAPDHCGDPTADGR